MTKRPAANRSSDSLAEQAAQRSVEPVMAARRAEVTALLEAGMEVMIEGGTERRPTVAEIVRRAGLSNQAFYRHFASKDELVAAIVDAGARRLIDYLRHQMERTDDPVEQVTAWIRGVLSQATKPSVAGPTRAVAWNRSSVDVSSHRLIGQIDALTWQLLEPPLAALGRPEPGQDAYLIGTLVFAVLSESLFAQPAPSAEDLRYVERFCWQALGITHPGPASSTNSATD